MSMDLVSPFDENVISVFRFAVEGQLTKGEHLDDVLAAGYFLGAKRANLLAREIWALDSIVAFSLWCLWPLKPQLHPDDRAALQYRRLSLFADFALGNTSPLELAVPESTLLLPLETIYLRQQKGDALNLVRLG
jgi:hypothetical protein